MKWIATFLCLLSAVAIAEETDPSKQLIPLPFQIQCMSVPPDMLLKQQYGEIGFIEGPGHLIKPDGSQATGNMKIFLDPGPDKSYTIFIELGEFHCMVMSGEHVQPVIEGTEL